jgi:phosphate-selective porin OprO/OprP
MSIRRDTLAAALALALALTAAAPLHAEEPAEAGGDAALLERLKALEGEVATVRRQLEVKKEEDARDAERTGIVTLDGQGFQLRSRDQKSYRLRLRGYVHSDARLFLENDEGNANDTFLIRRARPIFEGTLFEVVDFRIMPDFGGAGTSSSAQASLQDAWVNFRPWSWGQIQSGKFKAPVGLERLQSATALTFIERSLPTALAPNRDVGVQLRGDLREGFAQYQLAVMNGVLDGGSADADVNDGFDFIGRFFVHPFQDTSVELLQGLGVGVAASYGRRDGASNTATSTATSQYRSAGQQSFFSYGVGVSEVDDQVRIAPQAYWYWGPLGLMAEWTRSTPNLRLAGEELSPDVEAWQVTASWVVTGENKTFQGVVPRTSFNPAREDSGPGAWEIAARAGGFRIDDEVFDEGFANPASQAQEALEWAVGVNWYINPFLKFSVDYNDTRFDGGAPAGGDKPTEGVLSTRFQVAF